MGLEGSSKEGQGMFDPAEEEPLQTSGCCLGEKLQEHVWPTGLCPARGTHTHTTCSFSFPVALRASGWGQSQHIFFAAYSPDASDKWSSQAGYRDSILVSASAGNDGLESHLSDSKLTCRFSPLAIRILENKGGREGSRH